MDMVRNLKKHDDVEFVEEGTESQNHKYLSIFIICAIIHFTHTNVHYFMLLFIA